MHGNFDEEEEDDNAIVDCDILEAAKENIQPLACGRRATTLAKVLKNPHQIRNVKLEATRARHRECVREAQERVDNIRLRASKAKEGDKGDVADDKGNRDDEEHDENEDKEGEEEAEECTLKEAEEALLNVYVHFVSWTIEHYPRGQSAQSGILELLEEATRALRHSEHARADLRYLKLWIRYGTYVDHPEVIYEFLLANEIGTKWAKLYEEYAVILEKNNRRPKADEIYLLGIARKAEPLDHLEKRHLEFQKRMMVAAPVPGADASDGGPGATAVGSNSIPRRQPLAESSSTSTTQSASTPLATSSSTFDVFSAAPSSSSLASQGSSSQMKPRPNGRIPVFVDPTGEASRAADAEVNKVWPELGTRAERIKENRMKPEKMQGTVLKQKGAAKAALREAAARARAAPKFVPYRDPEPEPPVPASANSGAQFEVFRDPSPPAEASHAVSIRKFEVYRDPEPPAVETSSDRNFEVYRDPEPSEPSANVSQASENPESLASIPSSGKPFEVYVDPEPTVVAPSSKTEPVKDLEAPATQCRSRKSRAAPLTNVPPTPRRSARLNPKLAAHEPTPEPVHEESDNETGLNTVVNPPAAAAARPLPLQEKDASHGHETTSNARATALRPKGLGLGTGKGPSEAEALRKNPFKNYKDI